MSVMSSSLPKSSAKRLDVRTVVSTGMLCAIAYVVMLASKTIFAPLTVVGFLTFDMKDVIIAIGGFLYGPLNALCISVVTSLIELDKDGNLQLLRWEQTEEVNDYPTVIACGEYSFS